MLVQNSLRRQFFKSVKLNACIEFVHSPLSRLISNGTCNGLVDVESVREWSIQNEEIAKTTMKVPSPPSILKYDKLAFDSNKTFIDYLVCRQWNNFNPNCLDNEEEYEDYKVQCALLSHALTFPLTVGNHVNKFLLRQLPLLDCSSIHACNDGRETNIHTIRLCCVGPRAEANLPLEMWREFLIFSNMKGSKKMAPLNQTYHINWIIDFIGPDVPKKMKCRSVSLENSNTMNEKLHTKRKLYHNSLTMNYHCGFLHQYILEIKSLHSWYICMCISSLVISSRTVHFFLT